MNKKSLTVKAMFTISFSLHLVLSAAYTLADSCDIYPITLSQDTFEESFEGESFKKIRLGVGTGNYNWLSWDGLNDASSLAASLVQSGNSEIYINPYESSDTSIDIGDFIEGRPGVKNSSEIRENLNLLLNIPIQIPLWSTFEGQGSQFNYQTASFATIQLTDYKLNGKGYISFIYLGANDCVGNNSPIAFDAIFDGFSGSEILLELIATDEDNDPLTYSIITPPAFGTLSGEGPDFTYISEQNFVGSDSFEYLVNDGTTDSNIGSVKIQVLPEANEPPTAFDISLETTESTTFVFTVVASDPENDELTYIIVDNTSNGLLFGNASDGSGPSYTYIPNAGFLGEDSFTFIASDGENDSNLATASISIVPFANNPPVAFNASLDTTESTAFDVIVSATDEDQDPLTYEIVTLPVNGILVGSGPNYVYTPNPGFVGNDSFSFIANDGTDTSNIATIEIQVNPAANNPPVALDAVLDTSESTILNIELFATDLDNDPLTFEIIDTVANGTLTGNGSNYVYTPNPGFTGTDSFTFLASDGVDNSNVADIQINVLANENSPPMIESSEVYTFESSATEFVVSAFDPEGDPLTFVIVQPPEFGTLEGIGPGFLFTPDPEYFGEDFMLIKANDGQLDSETVEIRFIISE